MCRKRLIRGDGGPAECDAWLRGLLQSKPLVTMVSEMPYLALEWFRKKCSELGFAASHGAHSIQKFKTPPKIAKGLVIYETWGKTEAKVKQAAVDFGLEISRVEGGRTGSQISTGARRQFQFACYELQVELHAG